MTAFVSRLICTSFHGAKLNFVDTPKCSSRRPRVLFQVHASASNSDNFSVENSVPRSATETGLVDEHFAQGIEEWEDGEKDGDDGIEDNDETESGSSWYVVSKRVGKPDTEAKAYGRTAESLATESDDGTVDLGALDGIGRELLTGASYDHVVDIDIEDGGVLNIEDEDNNDLFCGVGLDALIENEQIVKNLREGLNIETATHVQLAGIPRVLDGKDIVIQSHTGTGKTLAFLLPLLDEIELERDQVQGIIVAPTRELGMQIFRECERLCEGTEIRCIALIGGANPARQADKLRRMQPHIVVGTPGRVAEMEENRELRVSAANMLVIDEVDQCMQPAFVEDVVYLLRAAPRKIQKVLVSATSDVDSVRAFAGTYLHKPVLLRVGGAQRLPKNITHWFCVVPARMRIELLRKLMHTSPAPARAIAFVDDPRRVDTVVERLYQMKIVAGALRGNAYKLERAEVLTAFRKGKIQLLVTTEVAARGLDIPEITHVFNLDLPTDGDHYVHRGGRCGRAGRVGTVVSVATAETAFVMGRLEKELGVPIRRMEPRGGRYSEVIQRPRAGADRRKSERYKVSTGGREMGASGRNDTKAQKGSRKYSQKSDGEDESARLEEAWDGKGIDEILELWQQETLELDPSAGDIFETGNEVQKGKLKAKAKKKGPVKEKVKVKKRARDLKNKGKPKGKLGRETEAVTAQKNSRTTGEKREAGDGNVEDIGRRGRVKEPRNLQARAKQQGWVGNR